MHWLPIVTTAIAFVFAAAVLLRYSRRGGTHLLLWGIGLIMYGLGTLAEAVLFFSYSSLVLHAWYLFGAVLTPAWLGQGTIFLLVRRGHVARISLIVLIAATLLTAVKIYSLPTHDAAYDIQAPVSAQYKDVLERDSLTTTLLAVFTTYGTVALVGGALYSAYIFLRKRIMPQRVLGNVLIAAGALPPALGGVLAARGLIDLLFISELMGAILMFIGFRLATAQQPVETSTAAQPA